MNALQKIISILAGSTGILFIATFPSLASSGPRQIGVLENIHGIPYPAQGDGIVILEDMAHADVYLEESVFAKQVTFTIAFDPKSVEQIDFGVRENSFWLSYEKQPLYIKGIDPLGPQSKSISISLTRMIQESDRSIDTMFFAQEANGMPEWSIQAFHGTVDSVMPSWAETKSYIKSVLIRERPL